GDTLTAPAVVEKDQRVRPPRQAMGRRPVSRQPDQIGPVFRRKVAPANHERNRNPNFDPRQPPLPHFLNESGYIMTVLINTMQESKKTYSALFGVYSLTPTSFAYKYET